MPYYVKPSEIASQQTSALIVIVQVIFLKLSAVMVTKLDQQIKMHIMLTTTKRTTNRQRLIQSAAQEVKSQLIIFFLIGIITSVYFLY